MTSTMTRPIAEVIEIVEEKEKTEDGPVAHIVKTGPGEKAAAVVLEARVMGTMVEALCGHRWIPSRNPESLPVCQKCKEIYEFWRESNKDLNERPAA